MSSRSGKCLFTWLLGAFLWSFETDEVNIVRTVYNPNSHSMETNIIEDIRNSMNQASSGSVCYGSRKGNPMTHFLANFALFNSPSSVWLDVLPRFLGFLIRNNLLNL